MAPHGRESAYRRLAGAVRLVRTWGDAYGYSLVATGRAEIMLDPVMSVWDCAALFPIVTEAGGTFTDWNGIPTIHAGEAIGTNSILLEQVLQAIRQS
jgi:fructose-1,6-bisphosphatase/inositol monophosphatase family enzyme